MGLDGRAPDGTRLVVTAPERPAAILQPPAFVTDALDRAIDAGAISSEDVDEDAWEALHVARPEIAADAFEAFELARGRRSTTRDQSSSVSAAWSAIGRAVR